MNYPLERAQYLAYEIENYYQSFGVHIHIAGVKIIYGLRRYIFGIKLLLGVKVQTIFNYAEDIQIALKLHLFYPFKEGTSILLAVSEFDVVENGLLKILKSPKFTNSEMQIPLALGYDYMGGMYVVDLAKLVHLLIVGPSGTGKSVALQCIVVSVIVKCPIDSLRLILFDIGGNSLTLFEDVKHLYHSIVKDVENAIIVLESLVDEMNERLLIDENKCQNLPFLVCIIDEFDDTIASITDKYAAQRFISLINSIIRRGRKAKVILVLASQDPTLKNAKVNINGIISRIAFKCAKHQNSSTALGVTGAENLSGDGAMLFKAKDESTIVPLQGSFVTSSEIEKILNNAPIGYEDIPMLNVKKLEIIEGNTCNNIINEKEKKELADIIVFTLSQDTISVNKIQKKFRMGKRANEIMESLCKMKIVADKFTNQPRKVIPICIEELSPETINLLECYDYDIEKIKRVFEEKNESQIKL